MMKESSLLHTALSLSILLSIGLLVSACAHRRHTAMLPTKAEGTPAGEFSPTTLLVMYDPQADKEPLLRAIKKSGAQVIYDYHIIQGMAIRKPEKMSLDEAIAYFRGIKGVISVERDRIYRLTDPVKPRVVDR